MQTVNTLLNRIQKVNIDDVINQALINTENDYAIKQREQMLQGLNSEGKNIGVYANPAYKAEKMRQNPIAGGMVDLFREGDFSRAIFARTDNNGFLLGSEDRKTNILQEKYGSVIFGLAPINKNDFIKAKLRPETLTILIKKLT